MVLTVSDGEIVTIAPNICACEVVMKAGNWRRRWRSCDVSKGLSDREVSSWSEAKFRD